MYFSGPDIEFLLEAAVGSYLIARFFLSRFGRFAILPPMALEIALGFVLARAHLASGVIGSPTYLLGEAGVVAVIAAGGTHVLVKGSDPLVLRSIRIAVIGVAASILFVGAVLVALSYPFLQAGVIALALAPSSAGVASRVLVGAGANRTREAKTFFVTAVFDDMLGLLGLAVVEVLVVHVGTKAIVGLIFEALVGLAGLAINRLVAVKFGGKAAPGVAVVTWIAIGVVAFAAQMASASPIVVAFVLAMALSHILGEKKITAKVERIGFILLPLFFVSLGAIAGGFAAPLAMVLFASAALVVAAVAAKLLAARIGFGSPGGVAVGVMLSPRAEITFVIALAGQAAGVLQSANLFMIAVVCVALGAGASVALVRMVAKLQPSPS